MPRKRPRQHRQRRPHVVSVHVSARQIRRRRAYRHCPHLRQRSVQSGAGCDRQSGAHQQTQRAAGHCVDRSRVAHHARHPQRPRRVEVRCSGGVLGIGNAGHLRTQQRPQPLQLDAGVIARHLLPSDDRDRAISTTQRPRDRVRIADPRLRPPQAVRDVSAVAVDNQQPLLNILRQQQHRRPTGACGRDSTG